MRQDAGYPDNLDFPLYRRRAPNPDGTVWGVVGLLVLLTVAAVTVFMAGRA